MAFPEFGIEATNPLFYFNAAGFVLCILLLVLLRDRRDGSGLLGGLWAALWVLCVGTGLHFLGDLTGVPEGLDHQFIHFALLAALVPLWLGARRDARLS